MKDVAFGIWLCSVLQKKLQVTEKQKLIEKTSPQDPFDYIDDTYFWPSNFYCTELYYSIDIGQITESATGIIDTDTPTEESESVYCGSEITIGEVADQAEEIASEILKEEEKIEEKIKTALQEARSLSAAPEQITCATCQSSMSTTFNGCGGYSCGKCCPRSQKQLLLEDEEGTEAVPDEFGCLYGCCNIVCEEPYCDSCSCLCSGSPLPSGVSSLAVEISNSLGESADKIRDLAGERVKITQNVIEVQEILRYCVSSEKIGRELQSCTSIKDQSQSYLIFYNEFREQITECYGRTFEDETIFDNYYCCQYETTE